MGARRSRRSSLHRGRRPRQRSISNADNSYDVLVNGMEVASNSGEVNYSIGNEGHFNVLSALHNGTNTIMSTVTNFGRPSSTPASNPCGLLYRLECCGHYLQPADTAARSRGRSLGHEDGQQFDPGNGIDDRLHDHGQTLRATRHQPASR